MAGQPNGRVRIELCDVAVEIKCSSVVMILCCEFSDQAVFIALVCVSSTITDLMPKPVPLLRTTTAEKKIVVDLVVRGSPCTLKNSCQE